MKYYYYSENNKQFGPFTLEEIKARRLKKSTLVWTEGMTDWISSDNIEELKDIFVSEPPPLPKTKIINSNNEINYKHKPSKGSSSKMKNTNPFVIIVALIVVLLLGNGLAVRQINKSANEMIVNEIHKFQVEHAGNLPIPDERKQIEEVIQQTRETNYLKALAISSPFILILIAMTINYYSKMKTPRKQNGILIK